LKKAYEEDHVKDYLNAQTRQLHDSLLSANANMFSLESARRSDPERQWATHEQPPPEIII